MARRRAQWRKFKPRIEPSRLVFIDETPDRVRGRLWTKTNMAPLRGWAPRGQRLKAKAPHRRWKTMTFLAALRQDRVEAPWLIHGPINGERFLLYVEKVLLPTLKPGDIVILDNLGSHKARAVRRAIRGAGAKLLFLPKILPRPQSDRAALRQAQALAEKGRQANHRRRLPAYRQNPPHRDRGRMPELLRQRRI